MTKSQLVALIAAGILTGASAQAQVVEFKGSTTACFSAAFTCSTASTATLDGVHFNAGTFDVFSSNGMTGFAGIGGGSQTLGYLSEENTLENFFTTGIKLDVNFMLPANIAGGQIFTASLQGLVTAPGNGGAAVFNWNNPGVYSFNGPSWIGTFSLYIDTESLTPGSYESYVAHVNDPVGHPNDPRVAITGHIFDFVSAPTPTDITTTPEPAGIALVATGLVALIPIVRKRRK